MTVLRLRDHLSQLSALRAAALNAVDPAAAVRRSLAQEDFAGAERVFVVGAGKAAAAMARATAEILGERLTSGVIAVPQLPEQTPDRLTFFEGGHPAPTEGSLAAGRAVADLLAQATVGDLVIALISGGGSALLELPPPGLSLHDLQATTTALLSCGATIHEINTVRVQLSQLKGGGLARLAYPARVLGLIVSDVVGNRLDVIASGPTVSSRASRADALAILQKYNLTDLAPAAILQYLCTTATPQSTIQNPQSKIQNRLIASNRLAGEAAVEVAPELGYDAVLVADDWQGEAREMGRRFAELVSSPLSRPERTGEGGRGVRAFIVGGESTVIVRGSGKGGRNQEAALAAALAIAGLPNIVISTFATDGVDGPTDAAGATATGETVARARALGLDPQRYLDDNDAYTFFAALGDLVFTGPTGTNVNDLMFGLVW